jgi:hypothetical protein
MKTRLLLGAMAAMILAAVPQSSAAQGLLGLPILVGTTGSCKSAGQFEPCTQTSTLVRIDPRDGHLIRTIGPVGYTVNGLAWDRTTRRLYATTSAGDTSFHGLITINLLTGRGTPVDGSVVNFGLSGTGSPIHSLAVDVFGHMVAWYDEFGPGVSDTYVRIDQRTGVATEFGDTGINTNRNGLAFGEFNLLWNIDSPKANGPGGALTQTAYLVNPFNGQAILSSDLTPPTNAALGDFRPGTNLYYGLDFQTPDDVAAFIVLVDPVAGTVTPLAQTVDDLHTLAFLP